MIEPIILNEPLIAVIIPDKTIDLITLALPTGLLEFAPSLVKRIIKQNSPVNANKPDSPLIV